MSTRMVRYKFSIEETNGQTSLESHPAISEAVVLLLWVVTDNLHCVGGKERCLLQAV